MKTFLWLFKNLSLLRAQFKMLNVRHMLKLVKYQPLKKLLNVI